MLWEPVRLPQARTGTRMPALSRDQEAGRVGMECVADQPLADLGTVGVHGVDEVDAELDCPAKHAAALCRVLGLAPDARTRESHRPEAHAVDGVVSVDRD